MSNSTSYSNRFTSPEEQRLYDHLLHQVELEAPDKLVERFRLLFIEGVGYPDRDVLLTLDNIVCSKRVDDYFRYILNRCCHILINRWQTSRHMQTAIPQLVDLFETGPSKQISELSRARAARCLRELVGQFKETEQFVTLKRLSRVVSERPEFHPQAGSRPLGTLIKRYPYLYGHCLVSEDSTCEHQRTVRNLQFQAQQRFEVDLSQYVTYRVRRSRLRRQGEAETAHRLLRPVTNPTLLSDRDLVASLRQFTGRVEANGSYRDVAQRFKTQNCQTSQTFGAFKDDLYDYVTAGIDPEYGQRQFNNLLHKHLSQIYPENDAQPLNDFLLVRTCSQLFNFLVVDASTHPQHFVFVDLISNLGAMLTTGILLKVLLICSKVKPYLERRLSILFNHYESATRDTVSWLVQVLENLNLALSLNFGSVDLSHVL
ncbi:hypothetical protein [Almyronema epifaneia]|uniref:Uncharacterized protein n=1 Tax=Almyronema epifaneia S1 TaxID=2991925 RepID=A0ABW6IJB6_9CYAN